MSFNVCVSWIKAIPCLNKSWLFVLLEKYKGVLVKKSQRAIVTPSGQVENYTLWCENRQLHILLCFISHL